MVIDNSDRETVRVPPFKWRIIGAASYFDGGSTAWSTDALRECEPIEALSARGAALRFAQDHADEIGGGERVVLDVQQEGCEEVEVVAVGWTLVVLS